MTWPFLACCTACTNILLEHWGYSEVTVEEVEGGFHAEDPAGVLSSPVPSEPSASPTACLSVQKTWQARAAEILTPSLLLPWPY